MQRADGSVLMKSAKIAAVVTVACLMSAVCGFAQGRGGESPRAMTNADYQRAEKFMGYNTNPLVLHSGGARPNWLAG